MNRNEAIKKIVSNYLISTGMSQSDFARRGGLARDYVNKLIKREPSTKYGISSIMFAKIADAMRMQVQDLEDLVHLYEENDSIPKDYTGNSKIKNDIINIIRNSNLNEKQLLEIYYFINQYSSKNS